MRPAPALSFGATWTAALMIVRRDAAVYLPVAAAFVLLPAVAATLLGPPLPTTAAGMTPPVLLVQGGLAVIGAVAQLIVARLALIGGTAREALAASLPALPRLLLTALVSACALVPAIALLQLARTQPGLAAIGMTLLLPGIYVAARLSLTLPLIAAGERNPVAALRASWTSTGGNGWRVLALLLVVVAMMLGVALLATAVGAAVGSVLTLAGGKAIAGFIVALVAAVPSWLYAVYNSALLAEIQRRLA